MTDILIKTDEFMDLYKEVEELLKNRGYKNGRSSMIMQFISSPEGRQFKEELNTCREMRNILSHCPDIDGNQPLVPTDAAIGALKRVVNYLSDPPLALNRATKGKDLFYARLIDRAVPVMNKMVQHGYSHVPVFDNGSLFGVFSISTVFSKALDTIGDPVTDDTLIGDFAEYLPIENHVCENFVFANRNTTIIEAETILEKNPKSPGKRIAAIFITQNGSPKEYILGMLTPWDIIGGE